MDKLIILNWKMQPTSLNKALIYFKKLNKILNKKIREKIYIAPPSLYALILKKKFKEYKIGLQNAFYLPTGPFTGEISLHMIKKNNLDFVILGHSERKLIFGENLETILKKLKSSLNLKIKTIFCFENIIEIKKLKRYFKKIENYKNYLYLAYEPKKAISTFGGKSIKIEELKKIKNDVNKIFPNFKFLYGGSLNEKNIKEYLEIDGFLIGIKSFKVNFVKKIIKALLR